jgi:hypothetical protein
MSHCSVHIVLNYYHSLDPCTLFILGHDGFEYPLEQDYDHFSECSTRLEGKLDECNRCRYVWDHWYGTTVQFDSLDGVTKIKA